MSMENNNNQNNSNQTEQEQEFEETLENQNQENQDNEDGENTEGEQSSKDDKKKQDDKINKMIAREKRAARNAVYKELGIDPKDKKTVELLKGIFQGKNESQNEDKQKQENSKSQHKLFLAEAKVKAITAKVKPEYLDEMVTLAVNKIDTSELLDDESVNEAIESLDGVFTELKTKFPMMYENGSEEEENKKGQKGTGSSFKSNKNQTSNKKGGLGERLAAQRRNQSQIKKSFWK